jgi:hypothetical protein
MCLSDYGCYAFGGVTVLLIQTHALSLVLTAAETIPEKGRLRQIENFSQATLLRDKNMGLK